MEYKVVTPSFTTAWTGSLGDCLHHIGNVLSSMDDWKSVTVSQAVKQGYSVVKAMETPEQIADLEQGRLAKGAA